MLATKSLEQDLLSLMPRARRYSRALIGNIYDADLMLAKAAVVVLKNKPTFYFLTPSTMVLPWLIIELHKTLSSSGTILENKKNTQYDRYESTLYEKYDSGLETLSEIQKRIYLLINLEQFNISTTASILGISANQVNRQLQQAHRLVDEHISANFEDS